MVKIKLTRTGRKNLPSYKVVVTEAKTKMTTRYIEELGNYSPITKAINLSKDRVEYWLSVGAQPTETVRSLLVKQNILKAPKTKRVFKGKPGKKATERAEKEANA